MKRILTLVGICTLLLAPATAHAAAYTWSGTFSTDWKFIGEDGGNWIAPPAGYPGKNQADDTATIADPSPRQCVLSAALENSVHSVEINATNGAMSLTLDNASSGLDIDRNGGASSVGYLKMVGGNANTEVATFNYQLGSFAADWFDLLAENDANRKVLLDFDQNFTLGDASNSVMVQGYADFNVAASITVYLKDMLYDASGTLELAVGANGAFQVDDFTIQDDLADAAIVVTKAGTGQVSADRVSLVGGNSGVETATCTVSAGSIVTR